MRRNVIYELDRQEMVKNQIIWRGVKSPQVLEAMREIPRHIFVPAEYQNMAYSDCPIPIGYGQTISQPYIVALMTELLALRGNEIVLEVGTGSGYQAAILAQIARQVHTIERNKHLASMAEKAFQQLKLENIHTHVGDGSLGLIQHSPFDGILVTAAAPRVPQALLNQLREGGRIVIPVGGRDGQYLEHWRREGNAYHQDHIIPVAFVPLIGKEGWEE